MSKLYNDFTNTTNIKQKMLKLSLIFLLVLNSGCSWLALLDTYYSPHEYECDKKLEAILDSETEKLNQRLSGLSKDEVISILGKPKRILSDSAWTYLFQNKLPSCGRYEYSMVIYFYNNKVIKVENRHSYAFY